MSPELKSYIKTKEKLLTDEFKLYLNEEDHKAFMLCTTFASVDVAARKITIRKWERNEYNTSLDS